MIFNPKDSVILRVKHGSHAYGLNTEQSDVDLRAICIEPYDHVVSNINNFEQLQEHVHDGHPVDCVIFGFKKFIKLSQDGNPNALEILFVENSEIEYINQIGKSLIDIRDKFLSKKLFFCFGGYAKAQLKRLENHRRWILNPPKAPPTRKEFNLPEQCEINADQKKAAFSAITKKLDAWNFKDMSDQDRALRIEFTHTMADVLAEINIGSDEQWNAAGRVLGFETNFLEVLDKERKFKNVVTEYENYIKWQNERNKKRYETEVKCLCDTKHASHLIRLYLECIDVLDGKSLILKRPKEEREMLLEIKQGKHGKNTYDFVKELQTKLDERLNVALINSKLPEKADSESIDEFMRQTYMIHWGFDLRLDK